MNKELTEMVFILDRSGSMAGLEDDTIGGFNAMVKKQQKEEGKALLSAVLFSDRSNVIYDRVDIEKVEPMNDRQYQVGGCTALLDAVGEAIRHIRNVHKYAREEDRPAKTVFVITTDGMENASREYDHKKVSGMIREQQEKGWEFLFLGANIDAVAAARDLGIREDRAVEYEADSEGTELNFEAVSGAIGSLRRREVLDASWKADIEEYHTKRSKR